MSKREYLPQLGKRIKTLRRSKNLKQADLAALCDFEKASMSRIESGTTNPTVLTLLKISRALQVDIASLLVDDPDTIIRQLPGAGSDHNVLGNVANLKIY